MRRTSPLSGSVFFALFAAIGMVGIIGAATMQVMRGPVRTMAEITKRTVAENAMIASGRMALVMSARQTGDCDDDGMIEPLGWADAGAAAKPANGGHIPSTIGAALMDPWGGMYGYCAWDHGNKTADAACGSTPHRLVGDTNPTQPVLAIISSGPDKIFQTGCQPHGSGSYILRLPNSDDIVLSYSYAEAVALAGDLWELKENDTGTATIAKNLSVTDEDGDEQLTFDATTKALALGTGGTGEMPNIKTDYIQNLSANAPIEFLAAIKAGPATITTEEENSVAAIVTASGDDGIGLKASGTSKAIEAEGILDMTSHKIVNLQDPEGDQDGVTKKYVDNALGIGTQKIKCESFVFTSCTGAASHNLAKTNLGACKKACEAAGVQCCEAEFASLPGNPNSVLSNCKGYTAPSQTSGGLRNILTILLGGGKFVSALCYLE